MSHFLEALRALGPLGILLLAIIDSSGIPVVSGVDALLVWISSTNPGAAYISAGAAILGSVAGSLILFLIARKGGEAYLVRYTSTPRGARLRQWFLEYGMLTIFVPALIPIPLPLKIFVLCAGALGVSPVVFTVVLVAARIPRYLGLARLGTQLGDQTLPYLKHHLWQLTAISIALFGALYLLIRVVDRKRKLGAAVTG